MRIPRFVGQAVHGDRPLGRLLRPLINRVLPTGPIPVTVLAGAAAGLRLVIEPQSEKFYWTGAHESAVQKAMAQIIKPGMVVWDVGAHIGFFAFIASRLVGPAGHVHAFEPLEENIARLREGVRLNGLTNLTVHEVAVSDKDGEAFFFAHEQSLMWSLSDWRGVSGGRGRTVACVSLDSMVGQLGQPNALKIDVEGTELQVAMGAEKVLAKLIPVIIEILDDTHRYEIERRYPAYALTRIDRNNWLMLPA